jgi:hypothetical protein
VRIRPPCPKEGKVLPAERPCRHQRKQNARAQCLSFDLSAQNLAAFLAANEATKCSRQHLSQPAAVSVLECSRRLVNRTAAQSGSVGPLRLLGSNFGWPCGRCIQPLILSPQIADEVEYIKK